MIDHEYPAGLDYLLSFARISAPGKPSVTTEAGYTTLSSVWYNGVSETVQAKYTLDTLLDAYQKGVAQTYLYELFDEPAAGAASAQAHYGLFNADGTPKLAATAIHNLTQILQDKDASAATTSGSLTYALSGTPNTAHDMVFAKSNGNVDLVLWAEPVLWSQTSQSEVPSTPSPVTVTFDRTEVLVKVYDPMHGTSPIATYANVSSIQVSVSDHPLVIEVTPPSATAGAEAPMAEGPITNQTYVAGVLASETTTFAAGPADLSDTKLYTAGQLTKETIVHADDSKDVYVYGVKNQNYVSKHDVYDAAAVLRSTVRTHADGSSDVKTYTNGVISNETVKYVAGSTVASIVSNYTNGTLINQTIKYAAGRADNFEVKTYANGLLTKDDIVHANNSEDVYYYGVQNYVAEHDVYNSARVLTSSVHTHADGTLAYSYSLAADGTKTTDHVAGNLNSDSVVRANGFSDTKTYAKGILTAETIKYASGSADVSDVKIYTNGVLTSDTIVHADKSKDVILSNVQNKTYVAEHDTYNSAGVLMSAVRTHTDGSLDYTYNLSSAGTKITDHYNASGNLVADSVVRANGSSEVKTHTNGSLTSDVVRYAPGSADLIDSKTYSAGVLTNETIVHASKAKDVFDRNVTGKSYGADHLVYDSAGRPLTSDLTNADGSHTQAAYLSGVSLTSTTGASDTLTAASVGGDTFIFKPNFGHDTIAGFHAGNATNHDTIRIDPSVASNFNHLAMQQVGHDTLITLDAHDSILIKSVLPSALHHDWS